MPTVRKLLPEEVQTIENKGKGQRKLTEEQYDRFLAEPNEKRLTVRNRLKAAASRRGLGMQFNRTTGNVIRFKIVSGDGQVAEQPSEPERAPEPPPPAPKRRGGRPRKTSA
jgi:hypothetical protein